MGPHIKTYSHFKEKCYNMIEGGYQNNVMENHFPKVQEFPTSVGRFHESSINCLRTLAQLVKKAFLFALGYMYLSNERRLGHICDVLG